MENRRKDCREWLSNQMDKERELNFDRTVELEKTAHTVLYTSGETLFDLGEQASVNKGHWECRLSHFHFSI